VNSATTLSQPETSALRRFYWSVRREIWENRSIYVAPLTAAGIVLFGFALYLFMLPGRVRGATELGPRELHEAIQQPYATAAIVLMIVDILVAIFYCQDALYSERRDRSVLFWKSLPVSDVTTVLGKASIPVLVLPLVTFIVTVATQVMMLLASTPVFAASGLSVATLWEHVAPIDSARINFSHLVLLHGIWYSPLYAWLLLVSAWASRVPFLWAVLPPVALGVIERIAFNSSHFATLLSNHFLSGPAAAADSGTSSMTMEMMAVNGLGRLFIGPGFWVAVALSAIFLWGAVGLRRYRGAL
jgi:ABC-2 type transport system permease protein